MIKNITVVELDDMSCKQAILDYLVKSGYQDMTYSDITFAIRTPDKSGAKVQCTVTFKPSTKC